MDHKILINLCVNLLQNDYVPLLTIRLELIESEVAFRPPLDENTSKVSVQETVQQWLMGFLSRGTLVEMLGKKVRFFFRNLLNFLTSFTPQGAESSHHTINNE